MERKKAARRLSFLLAAFLSACSSTNSVKSPEHSTQALPPVPVSELFNHHAFTGVYQTPCDTREKIRSDSIRAPWQPLTPMEFQKDPSRLALYSKYLTDEQKQEAQKLIDSIPPYVMDLFYQQGGVFVFTSRSLVEALPWSTGKVDGKYPFYESYIGLYKPSELRAFVTFGTAKVKDGADGFKIERYVPVWDSRYRVIHHEAGHFVDHMLRSIGGVGLFPSRFSDGDEFRSAVKHDLDALAARGLGKADLYRYSYYMPKDYKGVSLFGSKDNYKDAAVEIFAELWAEAQGYGSLNLNQFFPEAYKMVREIDAELKKLHGTRVTSACHYKEYRHDAIP